MGKDTIYYNKLWLEKQKEPDRQYMQGRVLRTFKALFSKVLNSEFSGRVLDVGSGDGSFVNVCTQNGIDAKGVDICHGIDLERDKLPFGDGEFDMVTMYSVIEHLNTPANVLLEIHRVLKNNGKLIMVTSNFELENPILCEKGFFNDPNHVHPYNRKSIRMLMKMYDFKEEFIGLWTVCKSHMIWKLPEIIQFYFGAFLPFQGRARHVPGFLKGRSKSMLCIFEKK